MYTTYYFPMLICAYVETTFSRQQKCKNLVSFNRAALEFHKEAEILRVRECTTQVSRYP